MSSKVEIIDIDSGSSSEEPDFALPTRKPNKSTTRKPITEERRQQLIKQLEKAREARQAKKEAYNQYAKKLLSKGKNARSEAKQARESEDEEGEEHTEGEDEEGDVSETEEVVVKGKSKPKKVQAKPKAKPKKPKSPNPSMLKIAELEKKIDILTKKTKSIKPIKNTQIVLQREEKEAKQPPKRSPSPKTKKEILDFFA
jgi:hypothetical protein